MRLRMYFVGAAALATASLCAATAQSTKVREVPPLHGSWSTGTPIPVAVFAAMAATLGNKIYVVGGVGTSGYIADNQIYDPVANTWSTGASLPVATVGGSVAVLENRLYVFGGYDSSGATGAVWVYNPAKNKWSSKATMPTPRGSTAVAVQGGLAYVIGGNGSQNRLNTVESYNPDTNIWAKEAPLLVGKSELSAAKFGTNTIVAAGGYTSGGDTGDNEGYSVGANTWTALATETSPTNESCTGSTKKTLYMLGGAFDGPAVNNAQAFSPGLNKWNALTPMPQAAAWAAGAMYGGSVYCFGGGSSDQGATIFNYVQMFTP